jgi:hypothetical protein
VSGYHNEPGPRAKLPFTEFTAKFESRFQQPTRLNRHIHRIHVLYSLPGENHSMSSALNVVQLEANRRNAQQSTGPRTEIGKKTSSLNALRHGLTSRIVVLLTEDLAAYQTFSEEFLIDLAPETFAERQCAQTIIDTQWRLNRVRSLEDGMLALGHFGSASQIDAGHPEIHAALTAAAVFREHSQAFVNLSMHEQRLYRILTAASKSLEDMKTKRIAARQADLDAAVTLRNVNKMLGVPTEPPTAGFVFTPEEIETECRRHRRLLEAKIAQDCNYDHEKFRQHSLQHDVG